MAVQPRRQQATLVTKRAGVGRRPASDPEPAAASKPAFVGRDEELGAVLRALDDPPALVLVEGEAGIGKTRLLREALASLTDGTVLVAACPPLPEPFPLGPVVDGVRRLRPDVTQLGLSPLGGALRPLFPELADQLPPALEPLSDPAETRHRVFSALTELVDRIAVEVLVVEDAHWADSATLEWLLNLISPGDQSVSVVVTYRPTDVPEGSLLLRLTSRPPADMAQVRIELEPLDVEQARQLVGSMLGTEEVSDEFAIFLHDHTDGLPLALEETIRLMRERHDIIHQRGHWTRKALRELVVPPTVRDSVLERVGRLDREARHVLKAAAVLVEPADEALLATVAGLDERDGRKGVAAALASGLLQETDPGRFVFRHVLDAQAVGDDIAISERRRLEGRAAEALEQLDNLPVARLCRHLRESGNMAGWSRYAEAAADLALESGDHYTAVVMLHQLLTTTEHPPVQLARLARKLGEVTVHRAASVGQLETAVRDTLRGIVAQENLPEAERGEIRLLLGWLLFQLAEFDAGHAEFEAAVAELGTRPARAARAMLFLATPESPRSWPAARHLEWLERASVLLPRIASPLERCSLMNDRAVTLLTLGEEAGWQAAAQIPESARTPAEQQELLRVQLNVAQNAITWGRYDEARQRLAAVVDSARTISFQRVVDFVRFDTVLLDWYTGAWGGLAETAGELADAEETHRLLRLVARSIQGMLDLAVGNRAGAEWRLRDVLGQGTLGDLVDSGAVFSAVALARLSLADGAVREAVQITETIMEVIAEKGIWLWATGIAPVHIDALVAAAQLDRAEVLLDQFVAWVRGRGTPAPVAALLTCRAIVADAQGEQDQAAGLFAEAASAWARLPRPYDELLALERQGYCLLAANEHDGGLAVLSDTQQRLLDLGARWDADRVAHLLRHHGVDVSRAWKRGPRGYGDQLSPREVEVVELVARGYTNRQVAEALFISPRTVERHLRNAMRKLDVSSRTALAMAAAEAGVLGTKADKPTP